MNIKSVETLLEFIQNVGSNEDIITGSLATVFYYCPKFTKQLFAEFFTVDLPKDSLNNDEFYVATGYSTFNTWLNQGESNLVLKPDLVISDSNSDWEKEPDQENLIIIESKLTARFGEGQIDRYKEFKRQFRKKNSVKLILLSINEPRCDPFDVSKTWYEFIQYCEKVLKTFDFELEKLFVSEMVKLMKGRLYLQGEDLKVGGKYCVKSILKEIKSRLDMTIWENVGNITKPDKPLIDIYESNAFAFVTESIGLPADSGISYFDFGTGNRSFSLNCGLFENSDTIVFWLENESDNVKDEDMFCWWDKIDLESDYWQDDIVSLISTIELKLITLESSPV